jgi:hypothetical protein
MNRYLISMLILTVYFTNSCTMKEKADLLLVNGTVYTADSAFTVVEAFAVAGGMIIDTGTTAKILSLYQSDLILDAGGKAVYPGFNDGHCHFYGYALDRRRMADLRKSGSFDEVVELARQHDARFPDEWVLGRGWDQNDWERKVFPDNSLLDRVFPDKPVVLTRIDGHAVIANSAALARAGITADTRVEGGQVILEHGKPTGVLVDKAAELMQSFIPQPGPAIIREALKEAQQDCFAVGLTSVSDAGLEYETVMLIDSMQARGQLQMRLNAMLSPSEKNLSEIVDKGPFQKERLSVTSIKLYADGALGSRGALLLQPYNDAPGHYGLLMSPVEYFREILQRAYDKGFQVNTHCIGDSANRLMLNLYGEILKEKNDRRWRIEHAQVVDSGDFELFGKYSIIPSVQATHATSDMYWAEERLGAERIKVAYAYQDLLRQNGWLINGTDFPIEEISPLLTFYAAVARQDLKGNPEAGFQPGNALSREDALRSMTVWPAKGSFEEMKKGTIEPGKFADFVILDRDIMNVPFGQIPGAVVLKTYIDGRLVFASE